MDINEMNKIKHKSLLPLIICNSLLGIGAGILSPIVLLLMFGLFAPSSNSEKIMGIAIIAALITASLILNIVLKQKLYKNMKIFNYLMVILGNLICSIGLGIGVIIVYFGV